MEKLFKELKKAQENIQTLVESFKEEKASTANYEQEDEAYDILMVALEIKKGMERLSYLEKMVKDYMKKYD